MTSFGTGHLQKIVIFKFTIKTVKWEVLHGPFASFARSNSLNANRHLTRFVPFEVFICEVLLYVSVAALASIP